jgi:hypothetical protein
MNQHAEIRHEAGVTPTRTSDLLRAFAHSLDSDRVTLAEIVAGLGDRGLGVLIAIFALPNILPSTVPFGNVATGIPPLVFAVQLMLGVDHLILPGFLARRKVGTHWLKAIAPKVADVLSWFERLLKPRMAWVTTELPNISLAPLRSFWPWCPRFPSLWTQSAGAWACSDRARADRARWACHPDRGKHWSARLNPVGTGNFRSRARAFLHHPRAKRSSVK